MAVREVQSIIIVIMTNANTGSHKQATEEVKQVVRAQAGLVLLPTPSFQPYINVAPKGGSGRSYLCPSNERLVDGLLSF